MSYDFLCYSMEISLRLLLDCFGDPDIKLSLLVDFLLMKRVRERGGRVNL